MKILKTCALIILSLFVVGTVSAAWVAPTQDPTDGNPPAPVNVGGVDQTKSGGLWVARLGATDLLLPTGAEEGLRKILTTNTDIGEVEWMIPSEIPGLGLPVGAQYDILRNTGSGWAASTGVILESDGDFSAKSVGTQGNLWAHGDVTFSKGAEAGKILVSRNSSGNTDWKTPDEGKIRPLFVVMNWNNTGSNNVTTYSYTSPGAYYRGSGTRYGDAPSPSCDDYKYCKFSCPDGFVIMSGSTMCNDGYSISRAYLWGDDQWQTGCIQDLAIFDFNVDVKAYPENVRIICVDEETIK